MRPRFDGMLSAIAGHEHAPVVHIDYERIALSIERVCDIKKVGSVGWTSAQSNNCPQRGNESANVASERQAKSTKRIPCLSCFVDSGLLPTNAPRKCDLKNIEVHLLDTGHFALEEDGDAIAGYIATFSTSKSRDPVLLPRDVRFEFR